MIDIEFIEKWSKIYDYPNKYTYEEILDTVKEEIKENEIISDLTLYKIIYWKNGGRNRHVKRNPYPIYEEAIKDVLLLEGEQKLSRLDGLPGILLPNASTIVHFIYPDSFPIVDIRTVRTMFRKFKDEKKEIPYLDPYFKINYYKYHLYGYSLFRNEILEISNKTGRPLREIDRALFAFDKETYAGQDLYTKNTSKH